MKRWASCVLAGAALGVVWAASPGLLLVLGLVTLCALLLWRIVAQDARRFVVGIFLLGFGVRAALSLGLDAAAWLVEGERAFRPRLAVETNLERLENTRRFMQIADSDYYSQRAEAQARRAKGTLTSFNYHERYGQHGYLFVMGAFYFLVGHSPMSVKLLNGLFGALLGPAMWFLATRCFNPGIARWTCAVVAFFPSLLIWSTTNLKEPLMLLLSALLLLLALVIRSQRGMAARMAWGAAFAASLLVHMTLRSRAYSLVLLAAVVGASLVSGRRGRFWLLGLAMLMAAGLARFQPQIQVTLGQLLNTHIGHVRTMGGSPYRYLPDAFYETADTIKAWSQLRSMDWRLAPWTAKAVGHYLLEPLPWKTDNMFRILAYPQVVAWYFCLGFALWGLVVAVKWKREGAFIVGMPIAAWIILGALTNGDAGTVFRFRDMVTPFVLMFTCAGAWAVFGAQEERQLLAGAVVEPTAVGAPVASGGSE